MVQSSRRREAVQRDVKRGGRAKSFLFLAIALAVSLFAASAWPSVSI